MLALARMAGLCQHRHGSELSADQTLIAYADRLKAYPADLVLAALDRWPDQSRWWPTWHELKVELDQAAAWRRQVRLALLEAAHRDEHPDPAEPEPTASERAEMAEGLRQMVSGLARPKPALIPAERARLEAAEAKAASLVKALTPFADLSLHKAPESLHDAIFAARATLLAAGVAVPPHGAENGRHGDPGGDLDPSPPPARPAADGAA